MNRSPIRGTRFSVNCKSDLRLITSPLGIYMSSGGSRISQTGGGGGGANPRVWGKNLLFCKIFAKNCMEIKEIGPKGRPCRPPLEPPMMSIEEPVWLYKFDVCFHLLALNNDF